MRLKMFDLDNIKIIFMNIHETEIFPSTVYKIVVTNNDKQNNFHVFKDGLDVIYNIDGEFQETILDNGDSSLKKYISDNIKTWLESKCKYDQTITNRENIIKTWNELFIG